MNSDVDLTWGATRTALKDSDPWFYRGYHPFVRSIAYLCVRGGISANAVTIAGGAIGILALALAVASPTFGGLFLAAILIQLWTLSDFSDGVVARLSGGTSVGPVLELAIHHSVVAGGVVPAVVFSLWRSTGFEWIILVGLVTMWILWLGERNHRHVNLWLIEHAATSRQLPKAGERPPSPQAQGRGSAAARSVDFVGFTWIVSAALMWDGIWHLLPGPQGINLIGRGSLLFLASIRAFAGLLQSSQRFNEKRLSEDYDSFRRSIQRDAEQDRMQLQQQGHN